MTQHFIHEIIRKYSEKEMIGGIDEGFTCFAAQTTQSLALEGLEGYPMMAQLN
jgi:hypothetical protein